MSSETKQFPGVSRDSDQLYSRLATALLEFGERAKDVYVYSAAYLVTMGVAQVATVMFALSLPLNPAPVVMALVVFAVYAGDRITDADADELSRSGQAAFARRHKRLLSVLGAASYGLAIAISVLGGPVALGLTLLPGAAWILYASDWLPQVGVYLSRLKDVFVVNSAVVALAWAVSAVFLPLSFTGHAATPAALVLFGYFFVDTFVNVEIPNVRDIESDVAAGVSTLPVVLGVRRTRHVLYALDAGLVAGIAYAHYIGLLSLVVTVAVLAGLAYAFVMAAAVGRTERYGRLAVSCDMKHVYVFGAIAALAALGI
ncbi:MAG: UbiA family prenyltransferase [Halarchaeum sp.]